MNAAEQRTEGRILVRQVTHIQASWVERQRGEDGDFTVQLILDQGADEYILQPSADDLNVLMQLFKASDSVSFDMDRKVVMFSNLSVK